jgi:hypothetical protein
MTIAESGETNSQMIGRCGTRLFGKYALGPLSLVD